MVCEVIGSFARSGERFDENSDLDLLIESKGALTESDVWDIAWTHLTDVDTDLIFADRLPAHKVALMREHSRA